MNCPLCREPIANENHDSRFDDGVLYLRCLRYEAKRLAETGIRFRLIVGPDVDIKMPSGGTHE